MGSSLQPLQARSRLEQARIGRIRSPRRFDDSFVRGLGQIVLALPLVAAGEHLIDPPNLSRKTCQERADRGELLNRLAEVAAGQFQPRIEVGDQFLADARLRHLFSRLADTLQVTGLQLEVAPEQQQIDIARQDGQPLCDHRQRLLRLPLAAGRDGHRTIHPVVLWILLDPLFEVLLGSRVVFLFQGELCRGPQHVRVVGCQLTGLGDILLRQRHFGIGPHRITVPVAGYHRLRNMVALPLEISREFIGIHPHHLIHHQSRGRAISLFVQMPQDGREMDVRIDLVAPFAPPLPGNISLTPRVGHPRRHNLVKIDALRIELKLPRPSFVEANQLTEDIRSSLELPRAKQRLPVLHVQRNVVGIPLQQVTQMLESHLVVADTHGEIDDAAAELVVLRLVPRHFEQDRFENRIALRDFPKVDPWHLGQRDDDVGQPNVAGIVMRPKVQVAA